MGLDDFVNTYGADCKKRYGKRVKKLTIDAKFTCPNRDGTLGKGGCTFCNVASFNDQQGNIKSIAEQLDNAKANVFTNKRVSNSHCHEQYIAYFQAYTSTYEEYAQLKLKYDQAVEDKQIVALHIGTRPDCVPDEVLDLLVSYQESGIDVWLELGLQTANDDTLKLINRGHNFAAYHDAVTRARKRNIKVCCHLILGLPNETQQDYLDSLQQVITAGVDGIKLHPLHIVDGSTMANQWRYKAFPLLTIDEYADAASVLIQNTPSDIIFHRVTAYAKKPLLLAPDWCAYRWDGLVAIVDRLAKQGGQGSALADDTLSLVS
ncbi:TIGR01212 family radical SAM protein [Shewanella gaetbuli]|uniref:TIGR01212 family radical SAM protein n=1 Tax=Shewanella gaetbuli TaxID=220752 RepID=A0A9X2CGY9_9GAMM|nr:TIGR01212 family radical SAM protein [Shewanella gaetbuli]MCL1141407.1 TIGR01212 family radical SAM protein [Shewanella gaetbuli]